MNRAGLGTRNISLVRSSKSGVSMEEREFKRKSDNRIQSGHASN